MKNTLERPPRTIMEVYKGLPEGTLAELIDNVIYMSPSPVYKHQNVLSIIFRRLCSIITDPGKGEVLMAPFDVYLDETSNAVQPDIIVVLNDNLKILNREGHIHGIPDLLVEVLSQGNKDHDLFVKKKLYERYGVPEYWIIDPETKEVIVYVLRDKSYDPGTKFSGKIMSPLLGSEIMF